MLVFLFCLHSDNSDDVAFRRLSALSSRQVAEVCEQASRVAACFQLAAKDLQSTPKQSLVGVDSGEMALETLGEIRCHEIKQTDDPGNLPKSYSTVVSLDATGAEPVMAELPAQTKGKVVPSVKRSSASGMKENKVPAVMQSAGHKASSGISEASNYHEHWTSSNFCSFGAYPEFLSVR